MSNSQAWGVRRSFVEAIKLANRNPKPLFLTMLVVLVPYALLSLVVTHCISPHFVIDTSFLVPKYGDISFHLPASKMQVRPIDLVVSSLSTILIACFSIMACASSSERPSVEGLFEIARRTWPAMAITLLYATLLPLLVVLICLRISLEFENIGSHIILVLPIIVVIVVAQIILLHFVTKWGIVISLLEEGNYGLKALKKALGLIKMGRLTSFELMVALFGFEFAISKFAQVVKGGDWENMGGVLCVIRNLMAKLICDFGDLYEFLVLFAATRSISGTGE